jgi:protein tyrosine/serine phosphatase
VHSVEPNWIELEGGANARDVGGLRTVDGRVTRTGILIRSANLQHLTPADLLRIRELGVRRVVDLRTDVEVAAEGPGPVSGLPDVTIHHLSLFPDSSEVEAQARPLRPTSPATKPGGTPGADPDEGRLLPWHVAGNRPAEVTGNKTADLYLAYLERRPDSVVAALRAIAEPGGATFVHCAAGKDRTGVVIAIALSLVGVERDAIVADYAATEAQISAIMALLARTPTYQRDVADSASVPPPKADVMHAVLDSLETRDGGIEGWLGGHGWTDADTRGLRQALLTSASPSGSAE